MLQIRAKILYNKRVKEDYFHLALRCAGIAREAKAGQFVNIKVSDGFEPLLRRPLSIHRVNGQNLEILYEVVGKATQILSERRAGEDLDVIGPLGNGFHYPLSTIPASPAGGHYPLSILVAGGMGVAPLVFLAEKLKRQKPLVFIGAATKSKIICKKEFKGLGCAVKIATDDGSHGFKGYVSDLLKETLTSYDLPASPAGGRLTTIYACGPRPMLKEIGLISQEYNIPAQISLEEHMACGIGACLGCVVKTKQGFKRVCKEGPVFDADEITWE